MATGMKLFLTLDYELFLGDKTGTPENCLIRPMDELCKVADKHGFSYIVFVDATYLHRMKQLQGRYSEVDRQYDLVSNHIKKLVALGHDIQLHFHPQWIYSNWDDGACKWTMDKVHYKLSDLSIEEANKYLIESKNLLDSLIGYKTSAFRAGGFCLNTFQDYKDIFHNLGLIIDSSVARHTFVRSPIHYYDYRKIPYEQIYPFSDSIKERDNNGCFKELSISSVHWNLFEYFIKIRPKRVKFYPTVVYKDGEAISDGRQSFISILLKTIRERDYLASIDGQWSNLLDEYMTMIKEGGYEEIILIGHPKNASNESIRNLDSFLSNHRELQFCSTKDV